jgi:preprotein translocase subunit SecF
MQLLKNTNIDFVGKRKFFMILSICIIAGGIILVSALGLDYGIDFEGGIEMVTEFEQPINTERIRDAVTSLGIEGAEIKSFGGNNQYVIRIKTTTTPTTEIANAIDKAIPDIGMKLIKVDQIGPKIGTELRNQSLLAVLLGMIAILIYVAFRFEFAYGLGAVLALLHDVITTVTVAVILEKTGLVTIEVNQMFIAAVLTVIGYSINDTVVIFDRIRENKEMMKGKSFATICNISINETLSRTIITAFTVLIALIALLALGGPVLRPFAVMMFAGTIFGCYSSIYIASSFVIFYNERKEKKASEKGKLAKA